MLMALTPPFVSSAKFNYFDLVAVIWLIIGFFRGRKRGMSQEFLPLMQWVAIVVLGGLFYTQVSVYVHQYAQFNWLWSNVAAYLLIAGVIHLLFKWFQQMFAEKLVEKDPFGRGEFYLGMMSGVVRFGCMIIFAMALMNSRVGTAAELAQTEKFQAAWFSDIRFPTYGEFQQDVLLKSFSGKFVQVHLKSVLIASVTYNPTGPRPSSARSDTIAQKKNQEIDDILGSTRR
jgi:uncharacterized membrane protein required for colicin V production